jgi:adenylate cyclase
METGQSLRRRLSALDVARDHKILHELAAEGASDFLALPIEYGDGSIQAMSAVTDHPTGFSEEQVALLDALRDPLGAAMEPAAMRRTTASLLSTYLGQGPSRAVTAGAIRRGDISRLDAVLVMSDLRGFTDKSNRWTEEALLEALGDYFELFVNSVTKRRGDVLKFLGDGILAVFPIDEDNETARRCQEALRAVIDAREALGALNRSRAEAGQEAIDFGAALHLGSVTYGNVGSPDRLDFTVIGDAVNLTSRVEGLCKALAEPILLTSEVARHLRTSPRSLGPQTVSGLPHPIEVLAP